MAMKRQEKGHDLRAEDCQNSRWGANSRLRWVDHSYPAGLFGVAGVGPRPWTARVVRHRRRLAARGKKVEMTTITSPFRAIRGHLTTQASRSTSLGRRGLWGRTRKLWCAHKSNQCWAVCGRALRERLVGGRASVLS